MVDQRRQSPRRILILTSSTGSGHDVRAYALKSFLELSSPTGIEVRVSHILEEGSAIGRLGVDIYNFIQKRMPSLHNVYWHIAESYATLQATTVNPGGRRYRALLLEFSPHVVVSMHDCLNRGYFADARRVLGAERVRCLTYCGEWSGGKGFSANWVDPSADLYIARTEAARQFAINLGAPAERSRLLCNLMPPEAFAPRLTLAEERKLRSEQGLQDGRMTYFLATGRIGANHHDRLLEALRKVPNTQAIAVCGHNRGAFAKLQRWKAKHPDYPLHLEGYSNRIGALMQVADAIVTRPGANTTAEALFFGCPVIYHTLGGVMPQECLTVSHFVSEGAAVQIENSRQLYQLAREWQAHPGKFGAMRARFEALRVDDHPASLVKWIEELATEAIAGMTDQSETSARPQTSQPANRFPSGDSALKGNDLKQAQEASAG